MHHIFFQHLDPIIFDAFSNFKANELKISEKVRNVHWLQVSLDIFQQTYCVLFQGFFYYHIKLNISTLLNLSQNIREVKIDTTRCSVSAKDFCALRKVRYCVAHKKISNFKKSKNQDKIIMYRKTKSKENILSIITQMYSHSHVILSSWYNIFSDPARKLL